MTPKRSATKIFEKNLGKRFFKSFVKTFGAGRRFSAQRQAEGGMAVPTAFSGIGSHFAFAVEPAR
ncbi:hypothetical protein [Puniceibacterium sp. IMCC21224]|uniref:hypothetical protein n=1 Tax=Puniceibacterium sp. IMCC21224 TaxID=1618204 RepID=UPI00064D81BF|nr:hypothetical protein [Puniceibacterium sp. IMCC21224]